MANLARLTSDQKRKLKTSLPREEFNKLPALKPLLHFIRQEKSYFEPTIKPEHIDGIMVIRGKHSNARIIAQSGAFLLFGEKMKFEDSPKGRDIRLQKFIIEKDAKENIRKELDDLNINERTLFPSLQSTAAYLKKKYEVQLITQQTNVGLGSMKLRKKLIEVALPLEAINVASAREKSIRHGHPSTLHLWWARRPLAAARAVIFSQMVDDPSGYTDELLAEPENRRLATEELERRRKLWIDRNALYEKAGREGQRTVAAPGAESTLEECVADLERERLFDIIRQLVLWENTTNETVLNQAREEIWKSWRRTCADNQDHPRAKELFNPDKLPAFHDPFAGGGSLPLEAQRLGLEAYASDLNPVAVLINKAMIEIPPKFAGRPPVNPESRRQGAMAHKKWHGAQGLAEDVRYYGKWMRDEAEKRIGHLYPKVEITAEMAKERPDLKPLVGRKLTVIAWLWARTVKSPNPAFANVDVPLASTFMLSNKAGKEAYVEPVIENGGYRLTVRLGKPKKPKATEKGTKLARSGSSFLCLHVWCANHVRVHSLRERSRAYRQTAHGNRC